MSHLDEQRLMELALGAVTATADEGAHIGGCSACREALAAERALSEVIVAVPQEPAPSELTIRLESAYAVAMQQRAARAPKIALVVVAVLLTPFVLFLATHWTRLVGHLSSYLVAARALGQVAWCLLGAAPTVPMVTAQAVVLLAAVAVLGRLLKSAPLAT